jgi:hypothetical protein
MSADAEQYTVEELKRQVRAWGAHIDELGLDERKRFVHWLSQVIIPQEFALLIDSEVERGALWKIYLRERYGP